MVLLVRHPSGRQPERMYALRVVLTEFLGLEFEAKQEDRIDTLITVVGEDPAATLSIADSLFACGDDQWLRPGSLPAPTVIQLSVPSVLLEDNGRLGAELPVLYPRAAPATLFESAEKCARLHLDVFGSVFLFLTRYEEIAIAERDPMDRFTSPLSLAGREGLLERPLVNEYVELLWRGITRVWPRLRRKTFTYRLLLSHDVDAVSVTELTLPQIVRSLGADVVQRRDLPLAARRATAYALGRARRNPASYDPYDTADFIMDVSERAGVASVFNFVAGTSDPLFDPAYDLDQPWVRRLLGKVAGRGHEIGLHPSYATYLDGLRTAAEFSRLQRVCSEERIRQKTWGGRQHYLRWRNPVTWQNWERSGLAYDSTLGFADRIGFRAGTCWEYPVFDLVERKELALRERPLVAMESSLLSYMNVPLTEAAQRLVSLAQVCRAHAGDFTLLWHGHMLASRRSKDVYAEIVRAAA